jgi:dUTP pyrophosphatase
MRLKYVPLCDGVRMPEYETDGSAGMDIRAHKKTCIYPGDTATVDTGFALEVPEGWEVQIRPRSGLALRGLTIPNSPGTIDSDYRGEIKIIVHNGTKDPWIINQGDRIAQMIAKEVKHMELIGSDELMITKRGAGGFGHTGTN